MHPNPDDPDGTRFHDEKGKWKVGNPGGPGRPPVAVEKEYRAAFKMAISPEDLAEIVQRAVVDAKAGDAKARELLVRYMAGAPEAFWTEGERRGEAMVININRKADQPPKANADDDGEENA